MTRQIIVADDHPLFREALKAAVGRLDTGTSFIEADSVATLLAALESHADTDLLLLDPFFLWVHYYDPHLPYEPPPGYYDPRKVTRTDFPYSFNPTQSDLDSLHELYSGEVRFVDAQVKKLIEGVGQLYNLDTTMVVIVADHGENLYEHDGYPDHSRVVYDTVMWIPCLIHLHGVQGKRIGERVSIVDVMPTLLDLVGVEMEGGEGYSLVGLMEDPAPVPVRSYVTCETMILA